MIKVTKGLLVKQPWVDRILNGYKTWEIRGSKTHIRGTIAIIQSKSGCIQGYVDLVDCLGPLTYTQMDNNHHKHNIETVNRMYKPEKDKYMPYPKTYAWVLQNAKRIKPIKYTHPQGAVIWVNL